MWNGLTSGKHLGKDSIQHRT